MLIYRVEQENGRGMYVDNKDDTYSSEMTEAMRHPIPSEDAALRDAWNALSLSQFKYCFGFSSLEQLKSWIYRSDWRAAINADGFKVAAYETTDFLVGDTQAVFRKATARLQFSISILEI